MKNSETDSDVELDCELDRPATPMDLVEAAGEASKEILPSKSKARYEEVYNNYLKWKEGKNATSNSENVVLAYISEMANTPNKKNEKSKPSTLWARYSMLKATMKIFTNIDISTYHKVTAYLKWKGAGYEPKKANVFTETQIQNLLDSALDVVAWLDVKVNSVLSALFFYTNSHK